MTQYVNKYYKPEYDDTLFYCDVCEISLMPNQKQSHLRSKKHKANVLESKNKNE